MKFIYGQEQYFIDKEISTIIKSNNVKANIYNDESEIENIIIDIITVDMFFKNKNIIIKDHPILKKEKIGDKLIEFLKKMDKNICVAFSLVAEKLNKNIKLVKYLLENAECKKFNKISEKEVIPIIKNIVNSKGGTISNLAAIKLSIKLPHNLRIIIGELNKLLLESNKITNEMIDVSISDYFKTDYFALSNALSSGDTHGILNAYQEKKKIENKPTMIIGQIASLLSLAIIVNSYKQQGLSSKNISEILKIHHFRIKKSLELISKSSIEKISSLIISLANLDQNIKTGKIDQNKGLDYFMLQLIK